LEQNQSISLPVKKAFAKDMAEYFAETDVHRRDAIAVRHLKKFQGHREKPLRLSDIKRMFVMMKNIGG
jgi:hypothetical protein